MAAQAVDFSVSGHINRALFITDSDASTRGHVGDNGSSGTRVRFAGSSEMENGGNAGVYLEYAAGTTLGLRYAEAYYGGGFGKVSIGQGENAGDGSVYSDKSGVFGIGHGQGAGQSTLAGYSAGSYFGSLDGGAHRMERIRYDTPAIGPVSAAVSFGKHRVAAMGAVSPVTGQPMVSPAVDRDIVSAGAKVAQTFAGTEFQAKVGTVQFSGGDTGNISASAGVKLASGVTISGTWGKGTDMHGADGPGPTSPSYFQSTIGYVIGDTSFAASWWQTSDFVNEDSEGTAIGIGANHNLPKVGAQVYAAVQNYSVEDMTAGIDRDETVAVVGTRIKF